MANTETDVTEPEVADILECTARNSPEKTFSQRAHFVTSNAEGESRELQVRLLGARDEETLKLNLRVNAPPSMSGTAILIKEKEGQDDIRIYLPANRRVQPVTGSMASSKLLGTDFSYVDVKQMFGAFEASRSEYAGQSELEGRPVNELVLVPAEIDGAKYDKAHAFIDSETCVPLLVEFRASDGQVLRKLEADTSSLQKLGEKHFATRYALYDLMTETQTQVEFSKMEFDEKISSRAFGFRSFKDAQ